MNATGTAPPRHCATLLTHVDDGRMRTSLCSGLQKTLLTLLEAHSPGHLANDRAWRQLAHRHGKDPTVTTIPGLLAAVESQERAEAPQPPGLAVALRPYQRQALGFMLDAEAPKGAGHFWSELPLPAQGAGGAAAGGSAAAAPAAPPAPPAPPPSALYFSPLLSSLTRDVPVVLKGGILAEESAHGGRGWEEGAGRGAGGSWSDLNAGMTPTPPPPPPPLARPPVGLGKTVICLALTLAAPMSAAERKEKAAAHKKAVEEAPSAKAAKSLVLPSHATLVVCMVSIVGQWMDEARSKLATGAGAPALKIASACRAPAAPCAPG